MRFVVCVKTDDMGDFSSDDLTLGRLYEVLEDEDAQGMLRLVDDSGEDYLYPLDYFETVEIPMRAVQRVHDIVLHYA
jgi:sporulation protein YlmC with PRC-barrel domain